MTLLRTVGTIQIEMNSGEWNFYPEEWIGLSSVLEDYA